MREFETCLDAIRAWIKAEDDAEHTANVMATTAEPQRRTRARADEARAVAVRALREAIQSTH